MITITFDGKEFIKGENATEVLRTMCTWFNPPTIPLLRQAFMNRAGIPADEQVVIAQMSNDEFIYRMAQSDIGYWTVLDVPKSDFALFP